MARQNHESQQFKTIHELGGECPVVVHELFEFMGIGLSDVFASFFLPDRLEATQAANGNKMAKRWRQKYPDYQVGKKGLGNGGGDLKKLASTVLLDME